MYNGFDENMMQQKIITRNQLSEVLSCIRTTNPSLRIVFTNGCFDLLHIGHLRLLETAKSLGDILIVGVNTDSSVRKLKGPTRPITPELERAELLAGFSVVDYVVLFDEDDPCTLISLLKPDIHVKGGDYDPYDYARMPEAKLVHEYGGTVHICNLVEGKSTTRIVSQLHESSKQ